MFGLKPQGTSLFGGSQSSSSPTPNPFGQPTQQQQQQPQSSSGGPGPSFLGGTTGGLFGNTLGTQQPQTQTGGLFGGTSTATQPQASGLFGNTTTTTQPQTGGLFGNSTSTTQPQTSGLFNTTQPQTSSLFGANTTTQPQTGSLFGANTTTQPGSLFGANTTPQPQTGGLFGTSTTTQPQSNLFGSTTGPSGGGFFGTSSQSQQQQPTGSSAFGGGSFFGSKPQQTQQLQITPAWTHIVLTKTTKFNDLPEDMRKELESLDTFIQSQSQISKDLHQRKLGEEPLKGYELIKGVNKDFVNCNSNIRHDLHFMRDLKAKVDRAVGDTIVATRIIDGFRNPQSGSGVGYLKEHAGFPFEFFSRVTEQIAARLSWYKATIEQIERKLTSTSHAQTPHSIAAALQAQHQTFLALASKTAALDAELQKIKTLYTQLWRQKTGSMRDPFDELDKGAGTDLGLEALSVSCIAS
ncbi:hypothetical protein APHAL10511_007422 [Amanita phalloides]|nr:hypothetical protein APHAL10511_007422 [Amanita phalloides]